MKDKILSVTIRGPIFNRKHLPNAPSGSGDTEMNPRPAVYSRYLQSHGRSSSSWNNDSERLASPEVKSLTEATTVATGKYLGLGPSRQMERCVQNIWEMIIHDLLLGWELVPQAEKAAWLTSLLEFANSNAHTQADAAKSLQSCPALCDPIDGSLVGTPVPGTLQTRILEWVAISFSINSVS